MRLFGRAQGGRRQSLRVVSGESTGDNPFIGCGRHHDAAAAMRFYIGNNALNFKAFRCRTVDVPAAAHVNNQGIGKESPVLLWYQAFFHGLGPERVVSQTTRAEHDKVFSRQA